MRNSSSRKWNGLGTNSSAPISNPSRRCSAVLNAVMNMIGTEVLCLMWRANSKPDPSGKPMSRITRSHRPSSSFFSARCLVSTQATSYDSRSSRSFKVAPSERSSSTSNSRFIAAPLRAHRVRTLSIRKNHLSQKPVRTRVGKIDRAVHSLDQLAHDVEPDAAAAAASMPHEELAQTVEVAVKPVTIVADAYDQMSIAVAFHRHVNLSSLPMGDGILDQICKHALQRPRISHNHAISTLSDQQGRPVMTQRVDPVAQTDRFEKERAPRQIYQEE